MTKDKHIAEMEFAGLRSPVSSADTGDVHRKVHGAEQAVCLMPQQNIPVQS